MKILIININFGRYDYLLKKYVEKIKKTIFDEEGENLWLVISSPATRVFWEST
jgi:hypothetical protein